VSFGQAQAEHALHHGGEVDPVEAGQPTGQFGVVESRRTQAHLGQARQVLIGGVQNPLVVGQHISQWCQDVDRTAAVVDRIDQHRSCTVATNLDQIRAVGIPES